MFTLIDSIDYRKILEDSLKDLNELRQKINPDSWELRKEDNEIYSNQNIKVSIEKDINDLTQNIKQINLEIENYNKKTVPTLNNSNSNYF